MTRRNGPVDYSPTNTVSGTAMVRFATDCYPDSSYELRHDHNLEVEPDATSRLNMIQITGEYKLHPNVTINFGYTYEQFNCANLMNTAGVTQCLNAVLPGPLSTNAAVQVVGVGWRVRF